MAGWRWEWTTQAKLLINLLWAHTRPPICLVVFPPNPFLRHHHPPATGDSIQSTWADYTMIRSHKEVATSRDRILRTGLTFKTSQPISSPSSKPRMLFPRRSSSSSAGRLCSSAVENIGLRLSPRRLSASISRVRLPRTPDSSRSGSRRSELCEKSSSLNGRPYEENIWSGRRFIQLLDEALVAPMVGSRKVARSS